MPAVRKADGDIDWTIPSNRKVGSQNWDGNERRREWWREKAASLGIPLTGFWLRDTARANHPYGFKPCQTCGRELQLSYLYPGGILKRRVGTEFPDVSVAWDEFPTVFHLVGRVADELGDDRAVRGFEKVLRLVPYSAKSLDSLTETVQVEFVDRDSRLLSPGAMSNSPDRLDGFHTYNLCCRGSQDSGRDSKKMDKYVVDRRAYEHWADGNWALADQIMRSMPVDYCHGPAQCAAKSHKVQLTGDHVGPISLGFMHSTHFNGLCNSCNSAKNNRMTLSDVRRLQELERAGERVVSDHAATLWAECAPGVDSDQDALLLSRVMRINQEMYLRVLALVAETASPVLLIPRLQLQLAATRITSLRFDPDTFDLVDFSSEDRQGTYAEKRVMRVIRIAFQSIFGRNLEVRNVQLVFLDELDRLAIEIAEAADSASLPSELRRLNTWIRDNVRGASSSLDPDLSARAVALSQMATVAAVELDELIRESMMLTQHHLIERFRLGDHRIVA